LIEQDRMRPAFLFERSRVRELSEEDLLRDRELAEADPELLSVLNVNEPEDYERARARAAPSVTVRRFGTLASGFGREPLAVRAATLEAAAAAAGLALDRHVVAALNGDQITRDPELPLAAGDAVAFLSADAGG
jgi:molybdenum cofactor guanylyltransferase